MESFVDDLKIFFDKPKIERTYLAGHPMGGYVACPFAEKYPGQGSWIGDGCISDRRRFAEAKTKRYLAVEDVQKNEREYCWSNVNEVVCKWYQQEILHKLIFSQNKTGVIGALKGNGGKEEFIFSAD